MNNPDCNPDLRAFSKLYLTCGDEMRKYLEIPAYKYRKDHGG